MLHPISQSLAQPSREWQGARRGLWSFSQNGRKSKNQSHFSLRSWCEWSSSEHDRNKACRYVGKSFDAWCSHYTEAEIQPASQWNLWMGTAPWGLSKVVDRNERLDSLVLWRSWVLSTSVVIYRTLCWFKNKTVLGRLHWRMSAYLILTAVHSANPSQLFFNQSPERAYARIRHCSCIHILQL